jgi:hypothetical protein
MVRNMWTQPVGSQQVTNLRAAQNEWLIILFYMKSDQMLRETLQSTYSKYINVSQSVLLHAEVPLQDINRR